MRWPYSLFLVSVCLLCCLRQPTDEPPVNYTYWDVAPAWSNAGDRIAFSGPGFRDSIFTWVLYMVDTNGADRTLLSVGGAYPTWVPGDTAIIFHKPDFKLYYLNLTTMQESLLCDCVDARFAEMAVDGKTFYYEDYGVANNWATSIYRMDLTTGDTTHIVGGTFPSVSSSGRYLLLSRHKVYRYDLVTDSEIVVFSPGDAALYDWSPDGNEVLVGNPLVAGYQYKIFKVKPDGTSARYFTLGKDPKYSPNGSRIALVRPSPDGKDHVWLISPDGSNAKQITF
ncbi:MAG TPA: hypothetical protein VN285_08300 [Candidatus Deferrimicrobium sp.]|nr:hypothetical protein [Candidatus Deferrimicrobium sp.]